MKNKATGIGRNNAIRLILQTRLGSTHSQAHTLYISFLYLFLNLLEQCLRCVSTGLQNRRDEENAAKQYDTDMNARAHAKQRSDPGPNAKVLRPARLLCRKDTHPHFLLLPRSRPP